jgi:hypothetical protein
MHEIVDQVKHIDRSGSVVIEFFLCEKDYNTEYIQPVMKPELFAVTCWYLWWQRRKIV